MKSSSSSSISSSSFNNKYKQQQQYHCNHCNWYLYILLSLSLVWGLFVTSHTYYNTNSNSNTINNRNNNLYSISKTTNDANSNVVDNNKINNRNGEINSITITERKVYNKTKSVDVIKDEIHVVFSTDCSFFQDWQTLLLFHSAVQVKQKGKITRIASGCDEEKKVLLTELYKKLYPQYHIHYTPDYKKDAKTGESYDFYNKPYGMLHFLDNADPKISDNEVIALIDPDMIFLRPLTLQVKGLDNLIPYNHPKFPNSEIPDRAKKGQPVASYYGLGAPWATDRSRRHWNRTNICGKDSPCLKIDHYYGEFHYSVGPPYILHKDDLHRVSKTWVKFVPKVYEVYPELLAEMYAYSMAASHEELPHFIAQHMMISNTEMHEEGWEWIDKLGTDVCEPPINGIYYPGKPLPTFLHHCQFFRAGEYGFQKRRIPKSLFKCDGPLMANLPRDLGKVNYKNRDGEIIKYGKEQARRNAFALCVIHRAINDMIIDYRNRMCESDQISNITKQLNLAKDWPNNLN